MVVVVVVVVEVLKVVKVVSKLSVTSYSRIVVAVEGLVRLSSVCLLSTEFLRYFSFFMLFVVVVVSLSTAEVPLGLFSSS